MASILKPPVDSLRLQLEQLSSNIQEASLEGVVKIIIHAHASFSSSNKDFSRLAKSNWQLTLLQLIDHFGCTALISRDFVHDLAEASEHTAAAGWPQTWAALQDASHARQQPKEIYERGVIINKEWVPLDIKNAAIALDFLPKHAQKRRRGKPAPLTRQLAHHGPGRTEAHTSGDESIPVVARRPKKSRIHDSSYSHGEIEQARRASRSPTRSSLSFYSDGGFEQRDDGSTSPESQYIYGAGAEHKTVDAGGGLGVVGDEEAEFGVAYHEGGSTAAYGEEAMRQFAHEGSDTTAIITPCRERMQDSEERPSPARNLIEQTSSLLGERSSKTERNDKDQDDDNAPHSPTVQEESKAQSFSLSNGRQRSISGKELRVYGAQAGLGCGATSPSILETATDQRVPTPMVEHLSKGLCEHLMRTEPVAGSTRGSPDKALPNLISSDSTMFTKERLEGSRDSGRLSHVDLSTILQPTLPAKYRYLEVPDLHGSVDWDKWAKIGLKQRPGLTQTVFCVVYDRKRKHWVLLTIDLERRVVFEYDSADNATSIISTVSKHITTRLGADWNDGWKHIRALAPQQNDSSSCGVHAVACIYFLVTGIAPPTSLDCKLWRHALAALVFTTDDPIEPPIVFESPLRQVTAAKIVSSQIRLAQRLQEWLRNAQSMVDVFSRLSKELAETMEALSTEQLHQNLPQLAEILPLAKSLCAAEAGGCTCESAPNRNAGPFAGAHSMYLAKYLEIEKRVQRLRSRISALDVALKRVRHVTAGYQEACRKELGRLDSIQLDLASAQTFLNAFTT
ncbi:hypothetical protein HBI81_257080 [Parastagonospora nodorum]|nr:hypothetical protein HBI73_237760 [Parastagonospora nodorum]KAH5621116.1 hypothetical protein HBI23_241100 [Parastagonospora nodorum]KAH5707006.1 hypothetical protein HBI18_251350 [Parastagonospora nodorum]KAH6510756.1 hypothetical protein HBI81_257080 [Parastagonospora nodorum]